MKKALLALMGAGVVAAVASLAVAQDSTAANSANAVGVIKYTIPAGGELVCVSLPLSPVGDPRNDGSWEWGATSLAEQLDTYSTVYFWMGDRWQDYTKLPTNALYTNGWARTTNMKQLKRGEAFFLRGVKTAVEDQTISLLGELPTDEEYDYDLTGGGNLDARGASVYPVGMSFGSTALADQLSTNDVVYFWLGDRWQDYTRLPTNALYTNGWSRTLNTRPVSVGEGMFIKRQGNEMSITHSRPFEWSN
jgi:hypothetical protein